MEHERRRELEQEEQKRRRVESLQELSKKREKEH
jgi:hypothetical protein